MSDKKVLQVHLKNFTKAKNYNYNIINMGDENDNKRYVFTTYDRC